MTIRKIVETRVEYEHAKWIAGRTIQLRDGSSWKMDESPAGNEYNKKAAKHVPPWRGSSPVYDATILKGKDKFYLKIDRQGKRRQVVPVHLPDPDKYHNPPERPKKRLKVQNSLPSNGYRWIRQVTTDGAETYRYMRTDQPEQTAQAFDDRGRR